MQGLNYCKDTKVDTKTINESTKYFLCAFIFIVLIGKMDKQYKFTSSLFHNERLKKVNFHGREMLPLYIRIVYNRESAFFKSYYFDLYQKPRYLLQSLAGSKAPSLEIIVEREKELIAFIKEKNTNEFSLELFKEQYKYYSRNILALMEEGFIDYLVTFFQDEGLPAISGMVNDTRSSYRVEILLEDLKSLTKPSIYTKLLENAVSYAPPYIPLNAFARSLKLNLISFFPVYLWDNPKKIKEFTDFLEQKFPQYDKKTTLSYLRRIIEKG